MIVTGRMNVIRDLEGTWLWVKGLDDLIQNKNKKKKCQWFDLIIIINLWTSAATIKQSKINLINYVNEKFDDSGSQMLSFAAFSGLMLLLSEYFSSGLQFYDVL